MLIVSPVEDTISAIILDLLPGTLVSGLQGIIITSMLYEECLEQWDYWSTQVTDTKLNTSDN